MIVQLQPNIPLTEEGNVKEALKKIGFTVNEINTAGGRYLVCPGEKSFDIRSVGNLPGVLDVHIVKDQCQLVSGQWKVHETQIDLGDGVFIGSEHFAIMAGPCSIENEEETEKTVKFLAEQGVKIMRGGVFKPRSSPYTFRGLGIEGLKMFHTACRNAGIKIITEVMQVSQIEEMIDYVDIFQVGARNSQNFNLLDALGEIDKPVLIKRGISGTIEELLASAEYVFSNGNEKIILCERGIRTFEKVYRNTFDINAIPILKEKSHLPVVADPSHGVGIRKYVEPVALASVIAGADGVLLEIHEIPERAMSDGQQTLNFPESKRLFNKIRQTHRLMRALEYA